MVNRRKESQDVTVVCREAVTAAPGAPGHVLSYMHALEIMQHYSQVLEAAQELLLTTRSLRCQTSYTSICLPCGPCQYHKQLR